mmetsp:Transcript_30334/g.61783  ORF Transcript_30334/g.61783 Transcript_30334/m.61783 type:complete len:114 (-) Transcript_30334:124-465(-)
MAAAAAVTERAVAGKVGVKVVTVEVGGAKRTEKAAAAETLSAATMTAAAGVAARQVLSLALGAGSRRFASVAVGVEKATAVQESTMLAKVTTAAAATGAMRAMLSTDHSSDIK